MGLGSSAGVMLMDGEDGVSSSDSVDAGEPRAYVSELDYLNDQVCEVVPGGMHAGSSPPCAWDRPLCRTYM